MTRPSKPQNFKVSLLALGSGALIGSALLYPAAPAFAKEPEIYFYPSKTWTLSASPVTLAGTAVPSCTFTNEFNNGFIVQLTGSHRWVESIQIDFRQSAFNPGQNYDVALSVPGINDKTLSGKAANTNVLVIDMVGKKDFYQSMRDSSVFDLRIDDNAFRFYMVGFAATAGEFERCMSGANIPVPSPEEIRDASVTMPMVNESIALEQAEIERKNVPITEIVPEIPAEIPVAAAEPAAAPKPAASVVTRNANAATEEVLYGSSGDQRQRLSEMLAEEISKNPDIAAADELNSAQLRPTQATTAPVAVEPTNKAASSDPADSIAIPMPGDVEAAAPQAPKTTAGSATQRQRLSEALAEDIASNPDLTAADELNNAQLRRNARRPAVSDTTAAATATGTPAPQASDTKSGLKLPPGFASRGNREKTANAADSLVDSDLEAQHVPVVQATLPGEEPQETIEFTTPRAEVKPPAPTEQVAEAFAPTSDAAEKAKAAARVDANLQKDIPSSAALLDQPEGMDIRHKSEPRIVHKSRIEVEADFSDQYIDEPAKVEPAGNSFSAPANNREIDQRLAALEAENRALNEELQTALKESKSEQLTISSENWNLESATKRYNEAELQVKRLGQQLQQERAACSVEKKELEALLFDPNLTDEAQLAKLAQLKKELEEAQEKIRLLERLTK